jgi:hypothetical protein
MHRTRSLTPCLALVAGALAAAPAAHAALRDAGCVPTAVRVDNQKIEILCAEPVVLSDRSQDRFREVQRFAYPMVAQSYQPQLGSQGKLLDYFLDMAQRAVTHSLQLHVWFDDDHTQPSLYGCDPHDCRGIVALAITHAPAPGTALPGTVLPGTAAEAGVEPPADQ